jgi:hypothetical protein
MLGLEANGLVMGERPHEGGEVSLGGGYATLGVGYVVNLSPQARVYPRVGIGVGGLGLSIDTEDPVDFDDVLANPRPVAGRQPSLSRSGMVFDIGAGLELLRASGDFGPIVGLRLGYLAAPFHSSWRRYEREAIGGPDASIAGPYVRVILGGAWRR